MTFTANNFSQLSVNSPNTSLQITLQGSQPELMNLWGYISTTDALATIKATDYFLPLTQTNTLTGVPQVKVGDQITVTGTDGGALLLVTETSPNFITSYETGGIAIPVPVSQGGTGDTTLTTAYGTLCAGTTATGTVQTVAPGTSGKALVSGGASALPSYTTLGVTGGGTGVATMTTAYAPVISGTTATGALQVASTGLSTSGYVLTSNGASAVPSFQAAPGAGSPTTAVITMTAAQWNGMYAAPYLIVAAPGANNILTVGSVYIYEVFGTAQFAVGGTVALQYDSTVHGAGTLASATVANTVVNGWAASSGIRLAGALASAASTVFVNKGLYLSNDTAAFTTGDGTFRIVVSYSTASVA